MLREDIYLSPIEEYSQKPRRPGTLDGASGSPGIIPVKAITEALERVSHRSRCHGYPGAGGPWEARVAYARYASKTLRLPGNVDPGMVIATAGAQHALHLLARVFKSPARIAVESPGFIEGIMAFQAEHHVLHPFPVGLDGSVGRPKAGVDAVYTVPSHHNPTGIAYPRGMVEWLRSLSSWGVVVIEDDPYRLLLTEPPPMIWSPGSNVVYVSTMSKILAPGLRAGFIIAPRDIAGKLELASQHDSRFQRLPHALLPTLWTRVS